MSLWILVFIGQVCFETLEN